MDVLVDTSVWIDYFKGGDKSKHLDALISDNVIVINEIILAELVPYLKIKKQEKVISLLYGISKTSINVHWDNIIEYQVKCLRNGANGVGIPDLIIAQNALQNDCRVYSLDKHFCLLKEALGIKLFE